MYVSTLMGLSNLLTHSSVNSAVSGIVGTTVSSLDSVDGPSREARSLSDKGAPKGRGVTCSMGKDRFIFKRCVSMLLKWLWRCTGGSSINSHTSDN
jgi:hypothetical protein